jgi:DNA-binding IscR family transcriptional regulator
LNSKQLCVAAVVEIARASTKPSKGQDLGEWVAGKRRAFETHFQSLVDAGILKSAKGCLGGYTLAQSASEITVGDVYGAITTKEDEFVLEPRESTIPSAAATFSVFSDAASARDHCLEMFTIADLVEATFAGADKINVYASRHRALSEPAPENEPSEFDEPPFDPPYADEEVA